MSEHPQNPKFTTKNPFIISVYSPKGGSGKTTLSIMLADFFAVECGLKVAVIDRDLQKSLTGFENLAKHLGKTLPYTIYGEEPSSAPSAQVYVLDHGPRIGEEFLPPKFTDVVVIPAQPSFVDFSSIEQSKKVLNAHGFKTVHLLNRFKKAIPDHVTLGKQYSDYPIVSERNLYPRAYGSASGVFSLPKTIEGKSLFGLKEARDEIRVLAERIAEVGGVTLPTPATTVPNTETPTGSDTSVENA